MTGQLDDFTQIPAREYQHVLRGPGFTGWRPLLVFLLLPALLLAAVILVVIAVAVSGRTLPKDAMGTAEMSPAMFALLNLALASLIPVAILATRAVHGANARFISSVTGGLRWRWMLRCAAIATPFYLVLIGIGLIFDPPSAPRPAQWELLLLLVFVGTPLQAAGEEYITRGLILPNVGAGFRNRGWALAAGAGVSSVLFVAAHGSADPWIVLDLGIFAMACCVLVWRTGGLEAAIALHAVNNMTAMGSSIVFGGWGEGMVTATSSGNPLDVLQTLVVDGLIVMFILRQARRDGIQRMLYPVAVPMPPVPPRLNKSARAWVPGAAVASIVVITSLGVMYGTLPRTKDIRLPVLRYADIAKGIGVTADGCLAGHIVDWLPMEVRHYRTRQLVGDEMQVKLGDLVLRGSGGAFEFPVSAELMTTNPRFHVLNPQGISIDYWYQIRKASRPSRGECGGPAREEPAA